MKILSFISCHSGESRNPYNDAFSMDPGFRRGDVRRIICAFFVLLLCPFSAQAQTDGERSFLCHRAVAYQPAVGVAFQPGVDVNGKPVAPADANPDVIILPPTVQVPITIDLAQWLQLDLPQGTRMESVMGFAEVDKDGKVMWNGQDISQNVTAACSTIKMDEVK
jgi:hypothetical protein